MRKLRAGIVVLAIAALSGCGYNDIQRADEQVSSGWSEVLNQYQRRADLVPNLVNTVKGFAAQEQQVLAQVTEARSRVGSIQATPELLNDEAAFRRFQQAQAGMSSALSRLLVVAENYPQLKSDANFRDLQAQLEGTENRIAVARNRYIKAVQEYNVLIPGQPDGDDVQLPGQAQLQRRGREGDLGSAEGGFQQAAGARAGEAVVPHVQAPGRPGCGRRDIPAGGPRARRR